VLYKRKLSFIFFLFFLCSVRAPIIFAADLSSPSFIVRDPIVGTGGGYYSSGSFNMFGAGHTNLSGYSTSPSFIGKLGFLYFPGVGITPTPTPTPTPSGGGSGGGGSTPVTPSQTNCRIADFNCDGRVDILDLSILLFYSGKTGAVIVPYDLHKDNMIDLQDISILFYYWDIEK
jgi:hypothetical protein